MLKSSSLTERELELQSAELLRQLLDEVPVVRDVKVEHEPTTFDRGIDLIVRFTVGDLPHALVCEVKPSGQPRHVREAVHHLKYVTSSFPTVLATPVFIAPYLSEESRALCKQAGVGYVDLEGNSRLVFENVFIERHVGSKPPAERRELKSLFKPKSAQVLRRLLREPTHAWKLVDLAEAAGVSLGHASNVRQALLAREWAIVERGGLRLTAPGALIDHWRDHYEPPAGERIFAYTPLHGQALNKAIGAAAERPGAQVMLASFSAAQWLAPYGRTGTDYLYVDRPGYAALREVTEIGPIARGGNLEITVMKDDGLFRDIIEPAPGVRTTSPLQTYLDLAAAGERGREAADHLRESGLEWPR